MPTLQMRSHTYRGFDRCVFCLKAKPPEERTDEHIIPEAIHGSLVISKGACLACARHTNQRFENQALHNDLLLPRLLLDLRGKRGSVGTSLRHLPPVFAGDLTMGGEEVRLLDFPVELYPKQFAMMIFPQAGFLAGVDRGGGITSMRGQLYNLGGPQLRNVTGRQQFINGPIARTVAKIAYCYAVAEKGFDAFDGGPIRDLICDKRDDVYNFVGNAEDAGPLPNDELHKLYFRERDKWLTVLVHLFASLSLPGQTTYPYEVVVGRKNAN